MSVFFLFPFKMDLSGDDEVGTGGGGVPQNGCLFLWNKLLQSDDLLYQNIGSVFIVVTLASLPALVACSCCISTNTIQQMKE